MHLSRLRSDQRGGVLVMSALMIPVFLLMAALVIDVGNWFTHNRQLQNRADAAAYAAGVEYAKNWKACVQTGNAALKQSTANEIADWARQYAGDPEASDYATGTLPALQNTEIANQANLDVVVNSSDANYTNGTDYTDGGAGVVADPCYSHVAGADPISPGGGQWTDVRVKERNLPSIFGGIGLPLSRAGARARVEIRPAISGHRFLPLAVPNNVIEKVQVRYYNECTGAEIASARTNMGPLANQSGFVSQGGGTLWGKADASGAGDPSLGVNLVLPQYDPSCGDYVPVGEEVRLASRAEVDLNQTCAQLVAARYADCFHRLSQIRIWNDGNPNSQPRLKDVHVTDGCGAPADGYFSRLPFAANNCTFTVTAEVLWGDRGSVGSGTANFHVSANGVQLNPPSGSPDGVWSSNPQAVTYTPGANTVTIGLNWDDNDTSHIYGGVHCKTGNNNPCSYSGTQPAHQAFVGTKGNSGVVVLVNNSANQVGASGLPGSPFDNHRSGGAPTDCNDTDTCLVFPTVGTESVLKTGVFTTLRLDDPQANQTLQCDPDYAQGQEFSAFRYGCKPWYGANPFTNGTWWNTTTKQCPDGGQWFSYNTMPAPFGKNSSTNPWRCVLTAPGMSTGQVGDDIAVATGNCSNINNNSCQQFACNYDGNYDGKPGSPNGWVQQGGDSRYPRVVNLFIVPYQGSKGLSGAGDTIPVLGFASFYVMNWTGANGNQSDPCPDRTWNGIPVPDPPAGAITGVFVETVDYEPGPVDPLATCVEGQLTPCRVRLVR